MDPSDLLSRSRTDEAAFAELVATYQSAIRGFTALWAPSRDEADDLAQEVFLAALHSAASFDPSRDLKTWLLGIARNLTRQAWKRVGRAGALGEALEREALAAFERRQDDRRRGALEKCVEGLHERDRAVFREYVVEELSSAELAERLSTTEGTVRATISRIRRRLRACIERRLEAEPA
jgi:RNA polymerase sigma-70 factor (ECF subfamily)